MEEIPWMFVVTGIVTLAFFIVLFLWLREHFFAKEQEVVARRAANLIVEYFEKIGVPVRVACVSLGQANAWVALIESEPMKQFRLSHILEMSLREHLHKQAGLTLERVFWRFPIRIPSTRPARAGAANGNGESAAAVAATAGGEDDYVNQGLVNYKDLPKFEATEIPWEQFQEASSQLGPLDEHGNAPPQA